MREMFPGFYRPTQEEFDKLWKEALFILDANVLLNLYRYPKSARDELLQVLSQISDRLWVPHQAALEFQRNRPIVLADQMGRFAEVERIVNGALSALKGELGKLQLAKRHAVIEIDPFLEKVGQNFQDFLAELKKLQEKESA
jgi:hypothetical protein